MRYLSLAGLLVLLIAGCAQSPPEQQIETATAPDAGTIDSPELPAPTPAPLPPAAPVDDGFRLSIATVGDMMIGTDYPRDTLPDDDALGFFKDVDSFLLSADLTLGNLEGVLSDDGVPAKACSNPRACYLFRSPTRYAQRYRDAGFDALSVANNHARDFGEDGRSETMAALQQVGIRHSGRRNDFASLMVKGKRVAMLAFAVTRESNLVHDYALAEKTVREHAANHDIVVVSFHGGAEGADVAHLPFAEEEYFGEPRGDVVKFARLAVDAGADLVFGHGPHVVRAMEVYKGRLIAYSLGNFATYYGISVSGMKGIAPILLANLDGSGRFVDGEIISTRQLRPNGPSVDPQQTALRQIQALTEADFGEASGLDFSSSGRITPNNR